MIIEYDSYMKEFNVIYKASSQDDSFLLATGGQVITDLFSALNDYEKQPINENKAFPLTIEGQKKLNDGKLIQVISVSSGSRALERSGHYLYLNREIKYSNALQAYFSYKGQSEAWGLV